ncbi:MAG: Nre family DNA repair protein [Candidatus Diapherotrites archaeon]
MISPSFCVRCKGRGWCGGNCRILEKHTNQLKALSQFSGTELHGNSPPALFVGRYGYPKVNLAPLSPPSILKDSSILESPERWFGLSQEKIISMREQLVRGNIKVEINSARDPSYQIGEIQETAMAASPVEVEIDLKNRPIPKLSFSDSSAPMGPSAEMKKFTLTENPSIPTKVDYLVSDTDVLSTTALNELYRSGIPVSSLSKLLSAGLLGVKKRRKFVPTRWAITAADSNIAKEMVEEKVKGFQQIGSHFLFNSNYLDNNFFVLLIPGEWQFEQLEAWAPGGVWTEGAKEPSVISDFEFYGGRKKYADNVAGAYYAAKLAVAEYLVKEKRQAGALIFREIGAGYQTPMGVWVIREVVRNAFSKKPMEFFDLNLVLKYIESRLKIPMKFYRKESKILERIRTQRKLSEWY